MICVDCGFDAATADLASALAVLNAVDAQVAVQVQDLRRRDATMGTSPDDLARVLRLCSALEDTRWALLGAPRRESAVGGRSGGADIPMYSALAILSTEAAWLQRASAAIAHPSSPTLPAPPVVADAVHALHHASAALGAAAHERLHYSAGETSPLS